METKTCQSQNGRNFDAKFTRNSGGDGKWTIKNKKVRSAFSINYGKIAFQAEITDFGHIGLFAEQVNNWQIIRGLSKFGVKKNKEFKVLNLFAYTGGSTLAAAQGGANAVHLDASKTSVAWARKNAELTVLQMLQFVGSLMMFRSLCLEKLEEKISTMVLF